MSLISLQTRLGDFRIALSPVRLRTQVRASEIGLVVIAAIVGALSGLVVTAMSLAVQLAHQLFFKIPPGARLSAVSEIGPRTSFEAPVIGGILLGLTMLVIGRWRKRPAVDPIEANALHGGRMSLTDSALLALQNLISNGCGASVGLEAGYTQISAGIASRLGLGLELRRNDLRTLVGCGAAAAIATAFNAPLTGAFYAFELIIGSYSIALLPPVVVAAVTGTLVSRLIVGDAFYIEIGTFNAMQASDYAPALLLGMLAAVFGILIMQMVTMVESLARRSFIPGWARPALGGAAVGGLALITPQVLSAGHGALHFHLAVDTGLWTLLSLILLKALASSISIGSGFRGGLFFASLFLGALLGKAYALVFAELFHVSLAPTLYAVVGMSALAVAVIGGPLTMTFLALELSGDFPITVLVLVASIGSSLFVRKTFGYSFATWRFHLRGESIRSAHDIGWIRTLTVGSLMRRDVRTVPLGTPLEDFRRSFALGSTQRVVVLDEAGRYAGIVLVAEAHAAAQEPEAAGASVDTLLRYRADVLLPQMNAKEAAFLFDKSGGDALAVVDSPSSRQVVGLLTESHTLRRYSEELDRRRREVSGEL